MQDPNYLFLAMRKLAREVGGTLRPWRGRRHPMTMLDVDGINGAVIVERPAESSEEEPRTILSFACRPNGRLILGPETVVSRLAKWFGRRDLEIGDAEFDRRFLIRGGPAVWVRKVLGEPAREQIRALAEFATDARGTVTLGVDVGPTGVRIHCRLDLALAPFRLIRFTQAGIAFLRTFCIRRPAGVEILGASEAAEGGNCPVCGDALCAPMRRCDVCRTLHHVDCWEYLGGCAIFACASARKRRAQESAARRAESAARRVGTVVRRRGRRRRVARDRWPYASGGMRD